MAEARALAARVGRLLADGTAPREIVLLTRATTDLRVYERALEDRGIPTDVIGGRGYWAHPQVIDIVSYRGDRQPAREEALFTVLASPLVGLSLDALVVLAATARDRGGVRGRSPAIRPVHSMNLIFWIGDFLGRVRRLVRHERQCGRSRRHRAS